MFQTIWTRRTRNFTIDLAWEYEPDPDLSFDDTGETAAKVDSGEWTCCAFRVTVHGPTGELLGADYLGNSIYAAPAEFIDHRACGRENRRLAAAGQAGRCGSYFSDMVHEACTQARQHLAALQGVRVRSVA